MRRVIVGLLVLGASIAGCGDTDPGSGVDPTAPAEAEQTSPGSLAPEALESSPAGEQTTEDAESADGLTGFGATRAAWDANHDQAPGYNEGAAYLPMAFENQPKYAGVCCDERIISYLVVMEPGTPLDEAQVIVSAEFPEDVTAGELVDDGECKMQLWESPTVQDAIGSNAVVIYEQYDDSTVATLTRGDALEDVAC